MTTLNEAAQKVLDFLANVPSDDTGDGSARGESIAEATGLSTADINNAVAVLVESGKAQCLEEIGSYPWNFAFVEITPKGRLANENAQSGSGVEKHQTSVSFNITAENFSGIAAGSLSGQTTIVSNQNTSAFDPVAIRQAIDELKKYKGKLGLTNHEAESLDREVKVVEAGLAHPNPDQSTIKRAVRSIKEIVEGSAIAKGVAQSVIAAGIIHLLAALI